MPQKLKLKKIREIKSYNHKRILNYNIFIQLPINLLFRNCNRFVFLNQQTLYVH